MSFDLTAGLRPRPRVLEYARIVGILAFAAFGAGVGRGVIAEEIHLLEPGDGDVVGQHPIFRVALRSGWDEQARAVLEISRDRWKTVERAWDTAESGRGWIFPDPAQPKSLAFRCMEALAEGPWEWRVRLIHPGATADPGRSNAFRVDATPPAEIDGLKLRRREDGTIVLSWDPVLLDIEGKPETIDHYVVYRYATRGTFPQSRPMRIGQTRGVSFEDRPPEGAETGVTPDSAPTTRGGARTLYFKVVAVDAAGNEIGLREVRSVPLVPPGSMEPAAPPSAAPPRPPGEKP